MASGGRVPLGKGKLAKDGKRHPTTGKGLHELVASTNYKPTAMEQILIDEYLGIPATYASGGRVSYTKGGLAHILGA